MAVFRLVSVFALVVAVFAQDNDTNNTTNDTNNTTDGGNDLTPTVPEGPNDSNDTNNTTDGGNDLTTTTTEGPNDSDGANTTTTSTTDGTNDSDGATSTTTSTTTTTITTTTTTTEQSSTNGTEIVVPDIQATLVFDGTLALNLTACQALAALDSFKAGLAKAMAGTLGLSGSNYVSATAACSATSSRRVLTEGDSSDVAYTYAITIPAAEAVKMAEENTATDLIAAIESPATVAATMGDIVSEALDEIPADDVPFEASVLTAAKTAAAAATYEFDAASSDVVSAQAGVEQVELLQEAENPTSSSAVVVKGFLASLLVVMFAC